VRNAQGQPIVRLSREQATAGVCELRDHDEKMLGLIFNHPDGVLFFSPQRVAELERRAAERSIRWGSDTVRGIAFSIRHSSTLRMTHTASFLPPGSDSFGRSI
jgi:hypothetical protein